MLTIKAIGGYDEVGRNMTLISWNDESVIFDCGIHLENYIRLTEDEDIIRFSTQELIKADAVPDINKINEKDSVVAIIPSHAHLDHIGAIPFLAKKFRNAKIYGTPFTMSVIEHTLRDEKILLSNTRVVVNPNSKVNLTKNITAEFIHMTHSTPHTATIALHTPDGIIVYANDFKFDLYPVLGKKPNFKRLKQLGEYGKDGEEKASGEKKVRALIVDSTYSRSYQKMPSESVARELLKDIFLGTDNKGKGLIITTFSSQIARLKSIIDFGNKLRRKIVFLGRSLSKYTIAAEEVGLVNFTKEVEIVRYWKQIRKKLKIIAKEGKHKYLLVVTGHQGEPKSTLAKMVDEKTDFRFDDKDRVIFSCKTIPTPTNKANREYIENALKEYGVRLYKNIHVSGHAAREDIRDLISMLAPEHIIPSHGFPEMTSATETLAEEMGYEKKKTVHTLRNGDSFSIN